jgi:hypothetical protein
VLVEYVVAVVQLALASVHLKDKHEWILIALAST